MFKLNRIDTIDTFEGALQRRRGESGNKRINDTIGNWTSKVFKLISKVFKLNKIDTIDTFQGTLQRWREKEVINALLAHLKIEIQKCSN